MRTRRLPGRLFGALGLASLFGFAACQQVLGLDQATVSVSAISRICECIPLTVQGLAFAGADEAACEVALATESDELLLAVAENDCTNCANVTPCYALLTGAGDDGDACTDSPDCSSWACCQGVLSVKLVADQDGIKPELVSTPPEARCCASCRPCDDAFADLNTETEVIACAEAVTPLLELLLCLGKGGVGDCDCSPPTPECLDCLELKATDAGSCTAEFQACVLDPARPIPVPQ